MRYWRTWAAPSRTRSCGNAGGPLLRREEAPGRLRGRGLPPGPGSRSGMMDAMHGVQEPSHDFVADGFLFHEVRTPCRQGIIRIVRHGDEVLGAEIPHREIEVLAREPHFAFQIEQRDTGGIRAGLPLA